MCLPDRQACAPARRSSVPRWADRPRSDAATPFFALVSSRHERTSTIVNSNKIFSAWAEVLCDPVDERPRRPRRGPKLRVLSIGPVMTVQCQTGVDTPDGGARTRQADHKRIVVQITSRAARRRSRMSLAHAIR